MKPCIPSARAENDIDEAADYYLSEAGADVARRFISAYDEALSHISQFPGTGSLRYARPGAEAELRFWPLSRFPYAVFYIARAAHIEIVRVLHLSRDLPAHLEPDSDAGP